MGPLRPSWSNSNEAKRGQGGSSSARKPQVGPNEPVFDPKWSKTTLGPKLAINSLNGPWQSSEATSTAPGKDFPLFNALHTQGPGVVHI
ncbi:hypothetical protein O181_112458 [Austropuccinia psidii MF-1]|uniref:Uncharacterized protein n=1 Tax=Austropuccinia psidii MF-1 TaxID=1389203 RepID=A0A9Q3K1B5_9BASI|nr:hypothetical protein [Austropuccinia psidii MF-1]